MVIKYFIADFEKNFEVEWGHGGRSSNQSFVTKKLCLRKTTLK